MNISGNIHRQAWVWTDTIILFMLLSLAAGFRFWTYTRLGIDHYDEGGYAMSALAIYEWRADLLYPLQHFLSPPLFFLLAGIGMYLLGAPTDLALMLTSSIAGTLTVGVVYMLARNNFGREAGIAAGILIALADYHISFSQAGLTDVTFCLFFLLALGDFTNSSTIKLIAGYEGIFCGFTAIYTALAQVLNEVYGKTVAPIGAVTT